MMLVNIILVALTGLAIWWVSGFDPKVTDENKRAALIRRGIRCGLTVFLLAILFSLPRSILAAPWLFLVVGMLVLLWAGCLTELGAHLFHRLVDPEDQREFDPNQNAHNLDMVASLLKSGQHEEAAQLCETLKQSGDANILVLETMLARSGIQFDSGRKLKPLTEAYRLRTEGKHGEAETILKSLLAENPSNMDAALLLIRLYVQDMRRSDRAAEVLRSLESQPHIPAAHIEYARRSINEWSQRKSTPTADVLPESVDELLACGYLGTAIETLEHKIKEQPKNFDLWLKLAEAHGQHSGNIHRAEKIVQKIASNATFSPEQIALAKARLAEWREARPQCR
jgi:tetratricopeptide (TPR) repeat protein